jgi:hypothetical protein
MPSMTKPARHMFQAATFRRRLLQWSHPLHSEDPLVRLYARLGLGLAAAGILLPHAAAWGALGCALLGFCSLWER